MSTILTPLALLFIFSYYIVLNDLHIGIAMNGEEQQLQINWDSYMRSCQSKMAPAFYFKHVSLI